MYSEWENMWKMCLVVEMVMWFKLKQIIWIYAFKHHINKKQKSLWHGNTKIWNNWYQRIDKQSYRIANYQIPINGALNMKYKIHTNYLVTQYIS